MLEKLRKLIWNDSVAIFTLGLALGTYLHWPALLDPEMCDSDWRQVPQWTNPDLQRFHPDDVFVKCSTSLGAPFVAWMYQTLSRVGDPIMWGKINAVLFFSFSAAIVYLIGRGMGNRVSGWLAAIIFLFFPSMFQDFIGASERAMAIPLTCLTVLIIVHQKWWWAIPVMAMEAIVYPMAAVQCGTIFAFDFLTNDLGKVFTRQLWREKLIPLLIAAGVSFTILGVKYLDPPPELGKLATRADMKGRPEFGKGARYPIRDVPPVWNMVPWYTCFHVSLLLIAYFYLDKRMFILPRGLYPLFFSAIVLYELADVFLMKLYFPSRYLRTALPLFMALAGGSWLWRAFNIEREKKRIIVLSCLLMVFGICDFKKSLRPLRLDRLDKSDLYGFVRSLPGRPMIAVHPFLGNEIPLMTGKSVLVHDLLSYPWWSEHWKIVSERTYDFFKAYYTTDPEELRVVIARHDIACWIIQPEHFEASYLMRKKFYFQPFNNWIITTLKPGEKSLVSTVPAHRRLFDNGECFVVSSEDLLEWLVESSKQAGEKAR